MDRPNLVPGACSTATTPPPPGCVTDALKQWFRHHQHKTSSFVLHLNVSQSDSLTCRRQQRALIIPNIIQKPGLTLATSILSGLYITQLDSRSHIALTFTPPFETPDSSLTVIEREQAEDGAAGVPTLIFSSPSSKRWWPGSEKGWTSDAGLGCIK